MFRLLPHAHLAILPGGHGAYLGEASALRVEGTHTRLDASASQSPSESQLPRPVAALIEEFLDEPMP